MSNTVAGVIAATLGAMLLACAAGGERPTDTSAGPPPTPGAADTDAPPTSDPTHTEDAGPVVLISPYVNETDMTSAMGYGTDGNSPWGFAHTGIDFIPNGDSRAFRAVCTGWWTWWSCGGSRPRSTGR